MGRKYGKQHLISADFKHLLTSLPPHFPCFRLKWGIYLYLHHWTEHLKLICLCCYHSQRLVCDFNLQPDRRVLILILSVCPASPRSDMAGSGCEHDGVIYRNGQSFTPSCKYQCVCVNGAIGCVGLCTESQPPRVWCQTPRRVKVPGQCCEKWICDEPRKGRKTAPRHAIEGKMLHQGTSPADTGQKTHVLCS